MRELGSHTTAELRNRIGDMFEGDSKVGGHRLLSIQLDISAPHVILPENFQDKDTSLVSSDWSMHSHDSVLSIRDFCLFICR